MAITEQGHNHREDCSRSGVHTATTAGIAGGKRGAYSIVMSGGYPDDDKGDEMRVTGFRFLLHSI